MQFGKDDQVEKMEFIKVVYFDDEGNTLSISDEIEVPTVLFYQDMDSVIYLNTTTYEVDSDLTPSMGAYYLFAMVGIFFLIIFSVVAELIIALFFKMNSSKAMINILLINFVTQILMYVYFFTIFDSNGNYLLHLYIYEVLVLIIEFAYLYWRLKDKLSWKRLALYVLIANIASYFLGLLREM